MTQASAALGEEVLQQSLQLEKLLITGFVSGPIAVPAVASGPGLTILNGVIRGHLDVTIG